MRHKLVLHGAISKDNAESIIEAGLRQSGLRATVSTSLVLALKFATQINNVQKYSKNAKKIPNEEFLNSIEYFDKDNLPNLANGQILIFGINQNDEFITAPGMDKSSELINLDYSQRTVDFNFSYWLNAHTHLAFYSKKTTIIQQRIESQPTDKFILPAKNLIGSIHPTLEIISSIMAIEGKISRLEEFNFDEVVNSLQAMIQKDYRNQLSMDFDLKAVVKNMIIGIIEAKLTYQVRKHSLEMLHNQGWQITSSKDKEKLQSKLYKDKKIPNSDEWQKSIEHKLHKIQTLSWLHIENHPNLPGRIKVIKRYFTKHLGLLLNRLLSLKELDTTDPKAVRKVKFKIVKGGEYLPLYDSTGKLIFARSEFDELNIGRNADLPSMQDLEQMVSAKKLFDVIQPEDEINKQLQISKIITSFQGLRSLFEQSVGVSAGYSLEKHTHMVLSQFYKYYTQKDLPDKISLTLFVVTLILHDAGKPLAIKYAGHKKFQHEYTNIIAKPILVRLGFTNSQVKIALALIAQDPIGEYFQDKLTDEESAIQINKLSKNSGLTTKEFLQALEIYFMSDASSYTSNAGGKTSLDHLFHFTEKKISLVTERQIKLNSLMQLLGII